MTNDTSQVRPATVSQPTVRRPALTREQILTAALKIIDESGVEALSMRRLGQVLNRNPMAVYRHAADKEALLDGVVERVISELVIPATLTVIGKTPYAAPRTRSGASP